MSSLNVTMRKRGILRSEYVLGDGPTEIGLLGTSGLFRRRCQLETPRERYVFSGDGRRTEVLGGQGAPIGELRLGWTRLQGDLVRPGLPTVTWRRAGAWGLECVFEDEAGGPIVALRPMGSWVRNGASVEVAPEAAARPDLHLLIGLAFYRMVRQVAAATTGTEV